MKRAFWIVPIGLLLASAAAAQVASPPAPPPTPPVPMLEYIRAMSQNLKESDPSLQIAGLSALANLVKLDMPPPDTVATQLESWQIPLRVRELRLSDDARVRNLAHAVFDHLLVRLGFVSKGARPLVIPEREADPSKAKRWWKLERGAEAIRYRVRPREEYLLAMRNCSGASVSVLDPTNEKSYRRGSRLSDGEPMQLSALELKKGEERFLEVRLTEDRDCDNGAEFALLSRPGSLPLEVANSRQQAKDVRLFKDSTKPDELLPFRVGLNPSASGWFTVLLAAGYHEVTTSSALTLRLFDPKQTPWSERRDLVVRPAGPGAQKVGVMLAQAGRVGFSLDNPDDDLGFFDVKFGKHEPIVGADLAESTVPIPLALDGKFHRVQRGTGPIVVGVTGNAGDVIVLDTNAAEWAEGTPLKKVGSLELAPTFDDLDAEAATFRYRLLAWQLPDSGSYTLELPKSAELNRWLSGRLLSTCRPPMPWPAPKSAVAPGRYLLPAGDHANIAFKLKTTSGVRYWVRVTNTTSDRTAPPILELDDDTEVEAESVSGGKWWSWVAAQDRDMRVLLKLDRASSIISITQRETRETRPKDMLRLTKHTPMQGMPNWNPSMDGYVGSRTAVTSEEVLDPSGIPGVRVDADNGDFLWRVPVDGGQRCRK